MAEKRNNRKVESDDGFRNNRVRKAVNGPREHVQDYIDPEDERLSGVKNDPVFARFMDEEV